MSAPRGLLGVALALWGASQGFVALGVVLGLLLEAMRLVRWPEKTFSSSRLAFFIALALLLAIAAFVIAAITQRFPQALYSVLRWLPLLLLPLPIAQALAGGMLPGAALRKVLRSREPIARQDRGIDTTHAYAAVVLIGAATGSASERWLYAGCAFLVAWALAARMPPARRLAGVALLAMGVMLGFAIHVGLWRLQGQVEEWSTDFALDLFDPKADAFRERTRIGDLGRIKMGDRIVMRVTRGEPKNAPLLLAESAFDQYGGGEWRVTRRAFRALPRDGDRWTVRGGDASKHLTVRRTLSRGEGLVPLPAGARVIGHLPADVVEMLPTGTVRAKGAPRFAVITVDYEDVGGGGESPDPTIDLEVPSTLAPTLDRIIAEEQLLGASPRATLAAIESFFDTRFSYSLALNRSGEEAKARTISDFLLRDRKGHCEYFATATVLVLRRSGIAARYIGGYSAQEYSPLEKALVVRSRHAHAWASAFIDGHWVAVDTTPARWADFEMEAARGPLGPVLDVLSWLIDRTVNWWLDLSWRELALAAAAAVMAGLLVPIFILLRRQWRRRRAPGQNAAPDRAARAWLSLEARLARAGYRRERGETRLAWAQRLKRETPEPWREAFVELVRAYYRARFDPSSSAATAEDFIRAARHWKVPRAQRTR